MADAGRIHGTCMNLYDRGGGCIVESRKMY